MDESALLFGHSVLSFEDLVEHSQNFVGVFGDLTLSLTIEEEVVFDNSQDVLVRHFLQHSLVAVDHSLLSCPVDPPLDEVLEQSYHGQIVIIPSFLQTGLEILKILEALLVLALIEQNKRKVIQQFLPFSFDHYLLVLFDQISAYLLGQTIGQQVDHVLVSILSGKTRVSEQADHQFSCFFVVLRAEVGLSKQQPEFWRGLDAENVLRSLLELSLIIQIVGVELLKCLNCGRIFEVALCELIAQRYLERGDDEALLVLYIFWTFLEELFGELVDLVVILALDGIAERPELVFAALHRYIIQIYT